MSAQSTLTKEMKESKFHELFIHQLKDIYWAETHLVKQLPKMSEKATSQNLIKAIDEHEKETEKQIERLEKAFELLEEKAEGEKCEAMQGLLDEAKEILDDTEADSMTRDAGIIIACQKVEHYEIATYGALVHLSDVMGHDECTSLLKETLREEKEADKKLNEIAKKDVNIKARKE